MRHYYAQINSEGIVVAVLDTHAEIVAPDMVPLVSFDSAKVGEHWTGSAFEQVVPPLVPELRHITVLAFLNRFTKPERIATDLASIDDPSASLSARQQAASVRDDMARIRSAMYIDLDRADTRDGVQLLESAGLIASGRAAAILDGPIAPNERYTPNL
jgi:hypothetical protein